MRQQHVDIERCAEPHRRVRQARRPSRLIPVSTIRSHSPPPASSQRRACASELITGRTPVALAYAASAAFSGPCSTANLPGSTTSSSGAALRPVRDEEVAAPGLAQDRYRDASAPSSVSVGLDRGARAGAAGQAIERAPVRGEGLAVEAPAGGRGRAAGGAADAGDRQRHRRRSRAAVRRLQAPQRPRQAPPRPRPRCTTARNRDRRCGDDVAGDQRQEAAEIACAEMIGDRHRAVADARREHLGQQRRHRAIGQRRKAPSAPPARRSIDQLSRPATGSTLAKS